MTTQTQFHSSVTPCEQYGTPHSCYSCASANSSLGATNDIAIALEQAGIACHIDQTGGFTMVGVCSFAGGTFTWNDECLILSQFAYDTDEHYEDHDAPVIVEATDEHYVALCVEAITAKAGA